MLFPLPAPLCPELTTFHDRITEGTLDSDTVVLAYGIELRADPLLGLRGRYTSPADRFLELETCSTGQGDWLGLHVNTGLRQIQRLTHIGFLCRIAGDRPWMIRPCLRSGLADSGFVDCFFDKHILTPDRPYSHSDALYLDSCPDLPLDAPWRELILFLPRENFRMSLHHLHIFAV